MNIYETALLCGIQKRPFLKEDKLIERCEVQNLQESLHNLVEAGFVEFHDSHINNVTSIFEDLKDRYPDIKSTFDEALHQVDKALLLQYTPTAKGKEYIRNHTYLMDYMEAYTLPEDITLDIYCTAYETSLAEFKKHFFNCYIANKET